MCVAGRCSRLTDRAGPETLHIELEGKQPPRGLRFLSWARSVGAVFAILSGVVGVSIGLSQQRRGLAPSEIDCDYRVELLRDRVIALTERSPITRRGDPQVHVVTNSIRETLAACSDNERASSRLETIGTHLSQHLQRSAGDEEARRELLAL